MSNLFPSRGTKDVTRWRKIQDGGTGNYRIEEVGRPEHPISRDSYLKQTSKQQQAADNSLRLPVRLERYIWFSYCVSYV